MYPAFKDKSYIKKRYYKAQSAWGFMYYLGVFGAVFNLLILSKLFPYQAIYTQIIDVHSPTGITIFCLTIAVCLLLAFIAQKNKNSLTEHIQRKDFEEIIGKCVHKELPNCIWFTFKSQIRTENQREFLERNKFQDKHQLQKKRNDFVTNEEFSKINVGDDIALCITKTKPYKAFIRPHNPVVTKQKIA